MSMSNLLYVLFLSMPNKQTQTLKTSFLKKPCYKKLCYKKPAQLNSSKTVLSAQIAAKYFVSNESNRENEGCHL